MAGGAQFWLVANIVLTVSILLRAWEKEREKL